MQEPRAGTRDKSQNRTVLTTLLSPALLRPLFWLGLLIITGLALIPVENPSLTREHVDKINHVAAFVLLVPLLGLAYRISLPRIALLLLGYGLLIEMAQYALPYRMFSLFDLAADGVGVLVGGLVFGIGYKVFGGG
ncbi:MAG: VanZ family protein [Desulfohalobiaceae bacterium]